MRPIPAQRSSMPPSYRSDQSSHRPNSSSISTESSLDGSVYDRDSERTCRGSMSPNEGTSLYESRSANSQYGTIREAVDPPHHRPQIKTSYSRWIVIFVLLIIGAAALIGPAVRERIREDWEKERRHHEDDRRRYAAEIAAFRSERAVEQEKSARMREAWAQEIEEHGRRRVEDRAREEEEQARKRRSWDEEVAAYRRARVLEQEKSARMREAWAQEIKEHRRKKEEDREREEEEQARERRAWDEEVAAYRRARVLEKEKDEAARAAEREAWLREAEDHERKKEENRKREEDERKRLNMFWIDIKPSVHCLSHGTREYTARLANIPAGYDRLKACHGTGVEIHGVPMEAPRQCEDLGMQDGVIGRWVVNFNEPSCASYWDDFKDKGCYPAQGSGVHRYESHLANLRTGSDWEAMCSTTPTAFNHMHFASPTQCADWGRNGYWGIWHVEDSDC